MLAVDESAGYRILLEVRAGSETQADDVRVMAVGDPEVRLSLRHHLQAQLGLVDRIAVLLCCE
jgi:hypothetical protein